MVDMVDTAVGKAAVASVVAVIACSRLELDLEVALERFAFPASSSAFFA